MGTVFKLDASNGYAFSTLANFNGENGLHPVAALTLDGAGNIYGTTEGGYGTGGTVFKLDASNGYALSTLASFTGAYGGPTYGTLCMDSVGNLYGTTEGATGGCSVFKLDASNDYALSTLAVFNGIGGPFDSSALAGLIMDGTGNLFGTTDYHRGTVFELTPTPEPTTVSLLTLGSLALLSRRK